MVGVFFPAVKAGGQPSRVLLSFKQASIVARILEKFALLVAVLLGKGVKGPGSREICSWPC